MLRGGRADRDMLVGPVLAMPSGDALFCDNALTYCESGSAAIPAPHEHRTFDHCDELGMFIVLLDEPGLFVFKSAVDAVRAIEPPDAESEIRAAFDDGAVPYRVEWVRPNRQSQLLGPVKSVEFGEYRFVAAGQSDPAALIAFLEEHSAFANPPEAEAELKSLLERMLSERNRA
jgi:hypothetical protein